MTIAYYTGMRKREIISEKGLRWDQVNLEEGSIRLASGQTNTSKLRLERKTLSRRAVCPFRTPRSNPTP